jgi:tetratricopeptide (TPR) repeat protein
MGRVVSVGRVAFAPNALILFIFLLAVPTASVQAQIRFSNPYDVRIGPGLPYSSWGNTSDVPPDFFFNSPPPAPRPAPAGTISSDILRHPLSGKARSLLQKIMHLSEAGDHVAAIGALREALVKQPRAEPYIDSLLGIEYLKTNQFATAAESFGKAVRIMPHESATHSNLGLSLALMGKFSQAETELNQALELDKTNTNARTILEAMHAIERSSHGAAD